MRHRFLSCIVAKKKKAFKIDLGIRTIVSSWKPWLWSTLDWRQSRSFIIHYLASVQLIHEEFFVVDCKDNLLVSFVSLYSEDQSAHRRTSKTSTQVFGSHRKSDYLAFSSQPSPEISSYSQPYTDE
jgi:hypothetical protein